MAEQSVVVRLGANVSGFMSGIDKASRAADRFYDRGNDGAIKNRQALDDLSTSAGYMGAGLAAGVGIAVKTYADFDSQMSAVASSGDDARRNIDALRESSIAAGASTAFSATEAAEGVENLLKAGVAASDVMGGGLGGSLDLAAAGSLGVAEASEIAATAMTQFKLEGKDVPRIADLLAAGAGKAQGEVSDLGAALNQSGLVANAYGLSIEETTGSLAAFASAGLLGSDAGTSFKTMLQALGNPTGESKELMQELGLAVYDAQGQFVGMEGLAGQLKTQLGGLTQEQRNAALATIFGSDAVRAANVLYDQGADGIAKWTADVNDQGYAAETAATKLDNLSGDLEALGGAFESALIGAGEGANGPLRALTQGATDAVNAFGALPAPVQQGSLVVAAAGAAALLGFAGVVKLVGGVVDLRDNLKTIDPDGTTAGKLKGIGQAAGGAATGLAAGALAAKLIQENTLDIPSGAGVATTALQQLGESAGESTDQLDRFFAVDPSGLTTNMASLDDAVTALTYDNGLAKFGSDLLGVVGVKDELALAKEQFAALDAQLAQMDPGPAAEATAVLTAELEAAGLSVDEIVAVLPQYRDELAAQAAQLGVNNLTNAEYVAWMGGEIPPAVRAAGKAASDTGEDTAGLTASLDEATIAAQEATEAYYEQASALLQASGSAIGMESAIDDATKAVEENGRTLNINTEKGRANRTALDNIASSAGSYRESLIKAGASTEDVTEATERGRKKFIETAEKMGMTRREAEDLADQYGLLPEAKQTKVSAPGTTEADRQVRTLDERIRGLNGKDVRLTAHFSTNAGETVSDIKKTFSINGGPKFSAYDEGGRVQNLSGRGRQKYDTELATLRVDEHVWTPEEVDAVGGHAAMYRMRQAALTGGLDGFFHGLRGYRDGGTVAPSFGGFTSAAHWPLQVRSEDFMQALTKSVKEGINAAFGGMSGGSATPLGSSGLVNLRGFTFTQNFANRLLKVEDMVGARMQITQGGYRPSTSYSGTSHAKDAVDITGNYRQFIQPSRGLGIAMGDRAGLGNWVGHAHGVPTPGAGTAGGSAIWQAQDYLRRGGASQSLSSPWGLWQGGFVRGAGTPTSDSNLVPISDGEYVVPPDVTARNRDLLDAMTYGSVNVERRYITQAPQTTQQATQHIDPVAIAEALIDVTDYRKMTRAVFEGSRQALAETLPEPAALDLSAIGSF